MLILDSCAFLYCYGNDQIGNHNDPTTNVENLRKVCNRADQIVIPYSTYIEIMTRLKESCINPAKFINSLPKEKFIVWDNMITCSASEKELLNLPLLLSSNSSANTYINRMVSIRQANEVAFSHFFFSEILVIYAYFKIKNSIIPSGDRLIALKDIYEKLFKNNSQYRNNLQEAYKRGYSQNDAQRIVKKTFVKCLGEACTKIDLCIEWISESIRQNQRFSLDEMQETALKIAYTIQHFNTEMERIVKAIKSDEAECQSIISYLSGVFDSRFTTSQQEYSYRVLLSQWLKRGKKFEKNDIFDFFWVSCLDYPPSFLECTYCITFDTKLRKFLKEYRPYMDQYIEQKFKQKKP